jgi:hypothetical protein
MVPSSNITLEPGKDTIVKFNVYNGGNETGQFHCVLYIDGSKKCDKQGSLSPNCYRSEMECWYRLYMGSDGKTRRIKFLGGYASGGVWINNIVKEFTVKAKAPEYGKFKIRVRDLKTSSLIDGAKVCLSAGGCKTTSGGITDWFSNINLDEWITGSITKTGYVDTEVKGFSVRSYNGKTLTYYMAKKEQLGAISITSKQSGVAIHVDGYDSGTAPVVVENLLAGKHSVRAMKSGYITQYRDVYVVAGETADVYFDLKISGNGDKKTELRWKKYPTTEVGANQNVEFQFQLLDSSGIFVKALPGRHIHLYVNGVDAVSPKITDKNGYVSFVYKFGKGGNYTVKGRFEGVAGYLADDTDDKTVTVSGEAKSAYEVTISGIPKGKTFKVESFVETMLYVWRKDPPKSYSVTEGKSCISIYRDDMGGIDFNTKKHNLKLFSDDDVLLAEEMQRSLRSENDICVVSMAAGGGKRWRINLSYSKNPQADKPFDVRAALIEAPGIPAPPGLEVQFYEIIEGAPVELTKRNLTNDYGVAIRHVAGKPEGEYIFDAEYVHGDTQREPVTIVVGEEKPPSELLAFLKPVVDWVMTTFGMSEEERGTAETYTYIGLGFIAVAVLGGFMK